jgi:hypothetical protein
LTGYKAPDVDAGQFGNTRISDASAPDVAAWYKSALGHDGDQEGVSYWQGEIAKGRNPDDVYKSFLQSAKETGETPNPAFSSWQQTAKSNYANARFSDPDSAYANTDIGSKLSEYRSTDFKDADSAYANPKLQNLLANFSMADFEADPGYQYRLDQGNRGVENSAAARGSQLSGATLKALSRFNQNEASGEYDKSFNRFRTQKLDQYGQSVDDFGRAEGQRLDKYGQRATEYDLADRQRVDQYGQRVDKFGRDEAQRIDKYGQRVDEFGRLENQRMDAYNQRTDLYNRDENQRINKYNIGTAAESRDYNRLAELAGIGQRVNESNSAAGRSYAGQVSANTNNAVERTGLYGIAAGNARASGSIGTANALTSGLNNMYGIYKSDYDNSPSRSDEMSRLRLQASSGG